MPQPSSSRVEGPFRPLPNQAQLPGIDPEIPPTRSRAFVGAWKRGRQAALDGRSLDDCPYLDRRNHRGSITFSRTFRRYWRDGFESVGLFPRRIGDDDGR
jgi:ribosome modulation factor